MESEKKYYKSLDIIRIIACVAVLLFHMNILKGGYLAVCSFFVLSGYLSCISAFKKEKFSIIKYYKNRFLHLYIPLLTIVLLTIFVVSFLSSINWINLKPETTSVLLGYNNFWQLNANLDYFTRHINSPFTHLWYISILFQFDIIFPFIFLILKKIRKKTGRILPCLIIGILTIASTTYFFISSKEIMVSYYNTFARVYSILFGVLVAMIHTWFKPLTIKKKPIAYVLFFTYLTALIIMMLKIESSSKYFALFMLLATIITCRLIDYGINLFKKRNKTDLITKSLSSITYEVYLVQYPVIFLLDNTFLDKPLRITLTIIITVLVSCLIHFAYNFRPKERKKNILRCIITACLIFISSYSFYLFMIAKDYSEDMKRLENQLNENEKLMLAKQEEYIARLKEEEANWQKTLDELASNEENLKEYITNTSLIGVGDSVMLGALEDLYEQFPKGYFDAKLSRTAWVVNGILKDLKSRNMLGNPIVFGLGANGDCPDSCKVEIMKTVEDRDVFWMNATNDKDVHVNARIAKFAENYDNLHVIDWETISQGHPEYFVADGIHLTASGRKAYTKAIYDAIYENYLDKIDQEKEELINNREKKLREKITFYGNALILNAFEKIHDEYQNAIFNIDKDYTYETLKKQIIKDDQEDSFTNYIVIALDGSLKMNQKYYDELIKIIGDKKIYILDTSGKIKYDNPNIIVINIEDINDYLLVDGVHINDEGNEYLLEKIKNNVKIKED